MSNLLSEPPTMPTMVSRLPKFGSRPKLDTTPASLSNSSTQLTNGFYHHPGPAVVNSTTTAVSPSTAKLNGFIRMPSSFSTKWRKGEENVKDKGVGGETGWGRGKGGHAVQRCGSVQGSQVTLQNNTKNSASSGKGQGQTVTRSSQLPQSSIRPPASKTGYWNFKSNPSRLTKGTKQALNSTPGSKPQTDAHSSLRRPRSFVSAVSSGHLSGSNLQKKPAASRSRSTESLGYVPFLRLSEENRFQSRSLTQVRQQPSPTHTLSSASSSSLPRSPSVTRSYSTNRPAHRGTLSSSEQAPPRGSPLKSPAGSPTGLKKTLLPKFNPAPKHNGLSYKLSRPSLLKQPRSLRGTPTGELRGSQELKQGPNRQRSAVGMSSTSDNSPEKKTTSKEAGEQSVDPVEESLVGETLEDISLLSTLSLDRNDICQEYMEDLDNLGNGKMDLLLSSSKNYEDDSGLDQSCTGFEEDSVVKESNIETELCFLENGMNWTAVGGEQRDVNQVSHRRRSSQPDYHDQMELSLDLSSSDSCGSGGTYMWDEEGLEPLGVPSAPSINANSSTTHHIGSCGSNVSSIDILNNLDSCDLGDDDLMLDSDFPEDASLSDEDGLSHMATWMRRQLCWGAQDSHNDNQSDFQSCKLTEDPGNKRTAENKDCDIILDLCPTSLGVDVEELAEDCSAVRSQLEFLQRLLLQEEDVEEDTLTTDTVSPEPNDSSCSSDSQVQALLQEVQQLREELKSQDQTIAQLTLQLTTGCRCREETEKVDQHTQTSARQTESVALQTPWGESKVTTQLPHTYNSQILDFSSLNTQEALTAPTHTLPPGNPTQPSPPSDKLLNSSHSHQTSQRRGHTRKTRMKEQSGQSSSKVLQQPSKLQLFLPNTSSSAHTSPKSRVPKQLFDPQKNTSKLKAMAFTSRSSIPPPQTKEASRSRQAPPSCSPPGSSRL
ncbi:serine-rich coiled-coil domain-containing protein 2 isoform X3 [Oryzias melastigma]|uniref:serine-rich coiled-coil domain-containing protein 2 isoform X3 n=1 Tax=Oryzias melastigma TaxID=30732 RepID=UPI00168CDEC6|nr:serine-rich coiled-coil domain-containing protein 2 isoform X3 [Oryzias melastigma]